MAIIDMRLRVLDEYKIAGLDEVLFKADKPVVLFIDGSIKDCGDSSCGFSGCDSGRKTLLLEAEQDYETYDLTTWRRT